MLSVPYARKCKRPEGASLGVQPAQDGDDDLEHPHQRSEQIRWPPAAPPGQKYSRGGIGRADQEDDLPAIVGVLAASERDQDRARGGQHHTERVPCEHDGPARERAVAEPCGVQVTREPVEHQPTDERVTAREHQTQRASDYQSDVHSPHSSRPNSGTVPVHVTYTTPKLERLVRPAIAQCW